MTAVTLSNLRRVFSDGFVAVDDLSISIVDGEFLTLLGPSGCGKSTTLRMIAGLDAPDEGDILFDSRRMNDIAPGKRNIAMVFQSYALYPHMTVRRNLEYPLRKQGVAKAERLARAESAADLMQLRELLERKPRELSGGQQQRVALGRALIRNPDLFLFDEPLSNLDAKLRSYMRAELIQLHRRIGKTMIYVTHDQLEAMTMSDRVAIMNKGHLQQLGTPHEVYNTPLNLFVASFIGAPTMNMMNGVMVPATGGALFRAGSLEIAMPSLVDSARASSVVLGVRPEDVLVGQGYLSATVALLEPVGHETLVSLDLSGHRIVARTDSQTSLKYGTTTKIAFRPGKLHMFAAEGGHRLT
jgi:multiple sugar transport system ATP-binding protein